MNKVQCKQCGILCNDCLDLYFHKKKLCPLMDHCDHCGVNLGLNELSNHILSNMGDDHSSDDEVEIEEPYFLNKETKQKYLQKHLEIPKEFQDLITYFKYNYDFTDNKASIPSVELGGQLRKSFPNVSPQKINKILTNYMGVKYDKHIGGNRRGFIGIKPKDIASCS